MAQEIKLFSEGSSTSLAAISLEDQRGKYEDSAVTLPKVQFHQVQLDHLFLSR